jgi:uncharacterized protein
MVMNWAVGFLAGFIGALGLGGGGELVMFLTAFLGMEQLKAQGVNLLFFIPVGLFALLFHSKKKLVNWKIAVPAILCGLAGAAVGCLLASILGASAMRKIFGVMLLFLGSWELFAPHKKKDK